MTWLQFTPPGPQKRAEALGSIHHLPETVQRLLDPGGFDPVARYAHLRDFFHDAGLIDEAAWTEKQLARVAAPEPHRE